MSVAIYLRTSTDEQNPENQLKDCLSINKFGDHEVLEDKVSAWKDLKREKFDKLKKAVIAQKIQHIIVWDLDRIYRNRKRLVEFFELCKIKKVQIHSYRQAWLEELNNIPEPFNEMMYSLMLQIMGWLAEEESKKKSERVRAAIRQKDDGAYSYKGNKWGRKKLSTFKKNKALALRKEGKSLRSIADELKISLGVVHKYLSETKGLKTPFQPSSQLNSYEQVKGGKEHDA